MNGSDSPPLWPDWFALPGDGVAASEAAFAAAHNLASAAQRLLRTTRAFAEAGRAMDLTSLPLCIGRITASALDLDPQEGRRLRPVLEGLLTDLDRLHAALEEAER
ncbi:MAG: hypothetical protein P4L66_09550 [Acetobacteraceae bacterium]|nr:hypothetical protein [Acetobacteraceae bacterium]